MTTIVVVRRGKRAAIAADSLTTFGDQRLPPELDQDAGKIQRFGDTYLATAGSAAHSLVLSRALNDKDLGAKFHSKAAIFDTMLALHGQLKEHYFLRVEEEDEDPYESSRIDALMANAQGIFGVYALREVYAFSRYWALGSGMDYALGALATLYDRLDDVEEIARQAVLAACQFDTGSSVPVQVKSVELWKTGAN